jgi:hypothetical protein
VEDDISEEIRLARAALFSTGLIVLDTKHSQMVPARIDARSVVIASAYNMLAAVHGDKL